MVGYLFFFIHQQDEESKVSVAVFGGSVVLHWTTDCEVSGSNSFRAPFEILHYVRDLYFSFEKFCV